MHEAPLTNKSYITNTIHVAKVSALSYVSGDFGSFMNWRSTCQMLRLAQSASQFKQTVRFGIFISSPHGAKVYRSETFSSAIRYRFRAMSPKNSKAVTETWLNGVVLNALHE